MSTDTANGSRPNLHTEQIVAIVISGLTILAVASIFLFLFIRRKLRNRIQMQQQPERGHHRRDYSYGNEKGNSHAHRELGRSNVTGGGEKQITYTSFSNRSFKENMHRQGHHRQSSDQVQFLPPAPAYAWQLTENPPRPPSPHPSMSAPQTQSAGTVQQPPPSYIHSNRDVVSPDIFYM